MSKIKCFGIAKEIIKLDGTSIDIDGIEVGALRNKLQTLFPDLSSIRGYMVAVNQEYASDDKILTSNDEVAIIPPVSGG